MKKYSFLAKISKKSDISPGAERRPKGFYYQGKNDKYIVLVGSKITNDTVRVKFLTEDVDIIVLEEK